ncbi:MAG: dihydroorotase [Neptuniibacter sp.]
MQTTQIKNARIINENSITEADLRIRGQRIEQIAPSLSIKPNDKLYDAKGMYLIPGMIDDQVHFREPGLTHKGNIFSESRAAVAGGITSYMEMPNVDPSTTTQAALNQKHEIAQQSSLANYSFYLGATEDNIEDIKAIDPETTCGVKVFMGASTGNLLVENPVALEAIFRECPVLIATHCESGPVIAENIKKLAKPREELTIFDHPIMRDAEACYASSSYAVSLAKKYNSQLNVLHITTAKELELFSTGPLENKHITAEACVHHLWFCDEDYERLGNQIKCNPAIKTRADREAIIQAVKNNIIDIIATDHAPHTFEEKSAAFFKAPAGLPLVQHALLTLFDHVDRGRLSLEEIIQKTSHNPAIRYGVKERGFIREGYFADLVLINPNQPTTVSNSNSRYHCGWTPFDGHRFSASIQSTWVNGEHVFDGEQIINKLSTGSVLKFKR